MDKFDYVKNLEILINGGSDKWTIEDRGHVVGSFDEHNAWKDYDDFLFKDVETTGKIALDFGCGPGRNIVKFANIFKRIDGADIGAGNLENVKKWTLANNIEAPTLYKINGYELNNVPNDKYDIVFSTIALQHIPVYEVRVSLMTDFYKVLKTGGYFCAQMGFGGWKYGGAGYYDNHYEGGKDTNIDNVEQIKGDLEKIGFKDFNYDIRPVGPGDGHANWIFFRVKK